jgi:hypothetical protein
MNKKSIFVSAPYTANELHTQEQNIKRAREIGKYIIELGYFPLVPHVYFDNWLSDNADRELVMDLCFNWISMSDVLLVDDRFTVSEGMQQEISYAEEINKPIIYLYNSANKNMFFKNISDIKDLIKELLENEI